MSNVSKVSCRYFQLEKKAMSRKFPVDTSNWKKQKSRFTHIFIQNFDDGSNKGQILDNDAGYPNNPQKIHIDLYLLSEAIKIKNAKNLYVICVARKTQYKSPEIGVDLKLKFNIYMNTELGTKVKKDS